MNGQNVGLDEFLVTSGDNAPVVLNTLERLTLDAPAFDKARRVENRRAKQAAKKGNATQFPLTDLGNAERLIARHGANLRHCTPWKTWLVWNGKRWESDNSQKVRRLAKETVRSIYAEAAHAQDGNRQAVVEHGLVSESQWRLDAMINLAQMDAQIQPAALDVNPWLLNVANGTLDLKTGILKKHDRADFLSKITTVAYDVHATCPIWEGFLQRVFATDADLIRFVQKAAGYTLTGDTSEQILFILHGMGTNGKSTFLSTMSALVGDYAQAAELGVSVQRYTKFHKVS